ncbi:MAG: hypothetical protein E6K56_08365 [Ignavibacteria bacterium]|nr:MAG: hypothetical protein E6K56_08365 [Ignavibacteria bacterium]
MKNRDPYKKAVALANSLKRDGLRGVAMTKEEYRKQIAKLPFEEKLKILEEMKEFAREFKKANRAVIEQLKMPAKREESK